MRRLAVLIAIAAALTAIAPGLSMAQPAQGRTIDAMPAILTPRDRVPAVNAMLRERLDTLLPRLMRESGIDMWLVINREYAEDPVYLTLVPEPVFAARRTTILMFHDRGDDAGVERLTVSRYPIGELYESAWEGGDLDEQWLRLAELIRVRAPKAIGIDVSRDWPVADGLTAGLRDRLDAALGPKFSKRLVPAAPLVLRWLETRSARELQAWPQAVTIARRVIAEAFSNRVITPGVTSTDDVAWYIRERFESLGLSPWFHPYVNVQRRGVTYTDGTPFYGESPSVIERGDVLHTDVGICYLRLCTDTQEMAYVLRAGEDTAPEGLRLALEVGNRWQDLLTGNFSDGRTGNEILAATIDAAESEGIDSSVYTHPLGFFGHAPGPTIGMWDNQGATPVRGDWALYPDTGYAIEGNVVVPVADWDGQRVQIKLEQSAVYDGSRVIYLAGRQTEWHLVQ